MKDREIFVGKSLRVFVSYSIEDQKLAHAVKVGLKSYGLDVFLAHDDVPGGAEWETTIVKAIKQTDIFIQLLTKNYRNSDWTDQETGIALSSQKLIIPLKVDILPYGFAKKYQAFNLKFEERDYGSGKKYWCGDSCLSILKLIFKKDDLKENLKDCLIRSFVNSVSFQDAREKASLLKRFNYNFIMNQFDEIIRGSVDNRQIYESSGVTRTFLKKVIEVYGDYADKERLKKLKDLINY